jgi:hypothetical protein
VNGTRVIHAQPIGSEPGVEGPFHYRGRTVPLRQFFCVKPILFLTLMARLGYDKSYSSGTDPIEPRKFRQPTPLTGPGGIGTALRKGRGKGRMSIDVRRSRTVIDLTLLAPLAIYLAISKQT